MIPARLASYFARTSLMPARGTNPGPAAGHARQTADLTDAVDGSVRRRVDKRSAGPTSC
jgi:hypothetical protein